MKEIIHAYFNLIFKVVLLLVLASALFLFTPLTTDFFDTSKFLVLLSFTGVMLILLTLKFTLQNKVVLIRTPLDIPLLLLIVVTAVSTLLSSSPYVSLLGHQTKVYGSLVSWIVLVIFYFLLTNNLKSKGSIKGILLLLQIAASLLSILSLLSYFGIKYLPSVITQAQNFTTTGLSFSTTAILALLIPFPLLEILGGGAEDRGDWGNLGIFKKIRGVTWGLTSNLINATLLLLFGLTIALTGSLPSFIGATLAVVLTIISVKPKFRYLNLTDYRNLKLIFAIIPLSLVGLVIALSYIPPLGSAKNPLFSLSRSYPREIQLPFVTSWKVAVSSFRDHPFWGSGPSSFLFDFTNYKPIEFNNTKFWDIRFDTAFNEYLQSLATLGGIGLLAFLSLAAMFLSSASKTLTSHFNHPTSHFPLPTSNLPLALAISGIIFFVILAFHVGTLALWIVALFILASFLILNLSSDQSSKVSLQGASFGQTLLKIAATTISKPSEETIKLEALPGVLLIVSLGVTLFAFFFAGKFTLADYHHKLALNAITRNDGLTAYNELISSEKLNPVNDLYRTDLAQVNFALANAIAFAKAPTEASPSGSLTDQDRQNIQVLLQQSINEARTAVGLSPRSVLNWEILAQLYRQIAGVAQNALVFSLDSFGRAIFQDPLNPNLRLNVGGTYYAIRNYDLAIRFFTDSINLKPDFANGYYNLSVALRDKGDLNAALGAAEKVVSLVDATSTDYRVASDYLNDLKSKVTPPTPPEPPAATSSGALQNQELPKVVNVGNPPEKIATPTAVKKPGATPEPTATP